ncbi:HAMP domain-containing sensor histidine kinase [uncultured Prevotella sp.]|uniref:sensor histidine kinase n=1 Tax=uncultured Prevotella sp. TaxID=159272 RepID=UPI0025D04DAA|nr:HAMP domain-containing sensor histidine kinase [uncultured Prevotella sp.]
MQWTDQIRRVKIVLVLAAVVIAVVSLVVSHVLIRDLAGEERAKMEVWAEAMRTLNHADENTDINLVLRVINSNNTIPVVVLDPNGQVQAYRNIDIDRCDNAADTTAFLARLGNQLLASNRFIRIVLDDNRSTGYIDVCYDDSLMLRRLASYPYIQLGVVMLFVVIAIFALLTSKRAEQNKVWVGLSKETAHQLGTPISSLMAWVEILRESYPDDQLIPEMENDVKRLQLIANRFSKIGSLPEPVDTDLKEVMQHVVDYMDRRTSKRVKMIRRFPDGEVRVRINASLFEWVIENLCKNAVDAMGGEGTITITVAEEQGKTIVEVSDTGKGIRKKDLRNVFRPGFTTKKRGWGLGLSLAKRIVEEYHKGRIWVKHSEVGIGTTFRIELKNPLRKSKTL